MADKWWEQFNWTKESTWSGIMNLAHVVQDNDKVITDQECRDILMDLVLYLDVYDQMVNE
jgi:ABC-type antimicrobial peptide transport system ATPase subunit